MAKGCFPLASKSAHKTLALSNLKRLGAELQITSAPL